MIRFKDFDFATAPRTGGSWVLAAGRILGLDQKVAGDLADFAKSPNFTVTLVRHPWTWLQSMAAAKPSLPADHPMRAIADKAKDARDAADLISTICQSPGIVGEAFAAWRADMVLKLEDFPWTIYEWFQFCGVAEKPLNQVMTELPKQNEQQYEHLFNRELKRKLFKAEADFCELYDYFPWEY